MFTGIVEETGSVLKVQSTAKSIRVSIAARVCGRGTQIGESISVNGCCLTVVKVTGRKGAKVLEFDLLRETWERTNLHASPEGRSVNLERSLRLNDRFGGHFVTGHIDGTGKIARWEKSGSDWVLDIEAPADFLRFIVFKGSVAVDGISLTVAKVRRGGFRLWIIPHTYELTALHERKVGDLVNLEADLLGKYVDRLIAQRTRRKSTL